MPGIDLSTRTAALPRPYLASAAWSSLSKCRYASLGIAQISQSMVACWNAVGQSPCFTSQSSLVAIASSTRSDVSCTTGANVWLKCTPASIK